MDYFPTEYFGGTVPGASPGDTDPHDRPLTDLRALEWARDQLLGSKLFGWVGLGRNAAGLGPDSYPGAWVYPTAFRESDDSDPIEPVRTLSFAVVVMARADDDAAVIGELDRLSNAVADLIADGPPGAIGPLSAISGGRYETPPDFNNSNPVRAGGYALSIILAGQVAYTIPGRSGRDAQPD